MRSKPTEDDGIRSDITRNSTILDFVRAEINLYIGHRCAFNCLRSHICSTISEHLRHACLEEIFSTYYLKICSEDEFVRLPCPLLWLILSNMVLIH